MIKVIFLDLDRTLIGDDYRPEPAKPLVERLKSMGFIIAFNSSKTFHEQLYYSKELNAEAHLIVENGSAIYINPKSLPDGIILPQGAELINGFHRIKLGADYSAIKAALDRIADRYCLKYYGNSTMDEIVKLTGLPLHLARLAAKREFSETVFSYCSDEFVKVVEAEGFKATRGSRFVTVTGQTDKGRAARIFLKVLEEAEKVLSVAVGDGENDIPMLDAVDVPLVIGKLDYNAPHVEKFEQIFEVLNSIINL